MYCGLTPDDRCSSPGRDWQYEWSGPRAAVANDNLGFGLFAIWNVVMSNVRNLHNGNLEIMKSEYWF